MSMSLRVNRRIGTVDEYHNGDEKTCVIEDDETQQASRDTGQSRGRCQLRRDHHHPLRQCTNSGRFWKSAPQHAQTSLSTPSEFLPSLPALRYTLFVMWKRPTRDPIRGGGEPQLSSAFPRRRVILVPTFAICISDIVPSCIRAPPDRHCTTTGSLCSSPYSKARVTFSPSAQPSDPPAVD